LTSLTRLSLGGALPLGLLLVALLGLLQACQRERNCLSGCLGDVLQTTLRLLLLAEPALVASLPQLAEMRLVITTKSAELGFAASLRALRPQLTIQKCNPCFG
jgi:hypothetical protein